MPDFQKSADKMDNLEKVFPLFSQGREEGRGLQAQRAEVWRLFPVLQEELARRSQWVSGFLGEQADYL